MWGYTTVLLAAVLLALRMASRSGGAGVLSQAPVLRIPPPYADRGAGIGSGSAGSPVPAPPSPPSPDPAPEPAAEPAPAGTAPGDAAGVAVVPKLARGCGAESVQWGEVDFGPRFRPPPSSPPTMQKVSCPAPPARKLDFFTNDAFRKQLKSTRYTKFREPWESSWTDVLALAPTDYFMHLSRVTLSHGKWQPAIFDGTHIIDQSEGCGDEQVSGPPPSGVARPSYARAIIMTQKWGDGVFHFLMENLPKLGLLHAAGVDFANVTVIVANRKAKHVVNYLDLFGIRAENIVNSPRRGEAIDVEDLYVTNQLKCGFSSYAGIQLTRTLLLARYPTLWESWVAALQQPRVLVVRRHGERAIANHDALVDALGKRWAVDVYDHRNTPDPAGVMRLFSRATVVVAPHGAGMGNMLFSRAGVGVVEFSHPRPQDLNLCFWYATVLLGGGPFSILAYPPKGGRWEVDPKKAVDDTARLMELVIAAWGQEAGNSS